MLKKIMSIVMVFAIFCMYIISNTNVYAIENEKELSLETDSYIDNEGHVHKYFDVHGNPVTIEQEKNLLNGRVYLPKKVGSFTDGLYEVILR